VQSVSLYVHIYPFAANFSRCVAWQRHLLARYLLPGSYGVDHFFLLIFYRRIRLDIEPAKSPIDVFVLSVCLFVFLCLVCVCTCRTRCPASAADDRWDGECIRIAQGWGCRSCEQSEAGKEQDDQRPRMADSTHCRHYNYHHSVPRLQQTASVALRQLQLHFIANTVVVPWYYNHMIVEQWRVGRSLFNHGRHTMVEP